jgi:Fur family ferric uptake transcriptional regulator
LSGEQCCAPRNTKQKNIMLDCLKSLGETHVTANGIMDALRARGTPVAKSTVYRFLASLENEGELRKYVVAEGNSACYQLMGESGCAEHYHMMCHECGGIVHFENRELRKIFGSLRDSASGEKLSIDGPRTVFYGICPKCANSGEGKTR